MRLWARTFSNHFEVRDVGICLFNWRNNYNAWGAYFRRAFGASLTNKERVMKLRSITVSSLILFLIACGESPGNDSADAEDPVAAAEVTTESAPIATAIPRTASADGARVFFITPTDGETLANPISIEFGISGMNLVRAGDNQPNSGHHHLLIDTGLPDLGSPIPADENHVHFGDASTATEITLPSGEHTLRMILGDHLHIPHDPPLVSKPITITPRSGRFLLP